MSKKAKKFTVPEFKTWLEGIMQFQNEDWSPNREQWEEIYSKIMDLKEPVNKEKSSLTEAALDEINNIVYYHITDTLRDQLRQNTPQPQQLLHNPQQPLQQPPQQPPQPPSDSSGMENLSLSDLKRQAEEKASGVGGQQASHSLPDHTDSASLPDDFV